MKMRLLLILLSVILPLSGYTQNKYPLGLAFSDFEYNKIAKRYFSVRGTRSLPHTYSLKQYCPKPLNQLNYNTSPGWAVSYAALTVIKAEQNGWTAQKLQRIPPLLSFPTSRRSKPQIVLIKI